MWSDFDKIYNLGKLKFNYLYSFFLLVQFLSFQSVRVNFPLAEGFM